MCIKKWLEVGHLCMPTMVCHFVYSNCDNMLLTVSGMLPPFEFLQEIASSHCTSAVVDFA